MRLLSERQCVVAEPPESERFAAEGSPAARTEDGQFGVGSSIVEVEVGWSICFSSFFREREGEKAAEGPNIQSDASDENDIQR